MTGRELFHKRDAPLLAVLLAAALAAYAASRAADGAGAPVYEIWAGGSVAETASLSVDRLFSLEQAPNVIFEVKNGAIGFARSDCPDKLCVRSGFISRVGQVAVCLPNRVCVRIVAGRGGADAVDAVTR